MPERLTAGTAAAEGGSARVKPWMALLVFLWPFVFLFPYVVTVKGHYPSLGNDFLSLYYNYKVYLLDGLSHGRIPLWSPSEGAGYPFYSSPFTQSFYPLNVPLAVFYRLAGGYLVLDHQRYAVLGISIFGLGMFSWLRLLGLGVRSVLFGALVVSVSYKMTEILRFPNAIHTAAWYPWILFAITAIVRGDSLGKSVAYGLGLVVSLICFFTGGYPYYVFYSPFLFGPYLLMLALRPLREKWLGDRPIRWGQALVVLLGAGAAALAICSPYLYRMASLMGQTTDRASKDWDYSTLAAFDLEDTLGSWVFPPAALFEGWYYFGLLGFFLVVLFFFGGGEGNRTYRTYGAYGTYRTNWTNGQGNPWRRDGWTKLFFLLWIATISYITYGRKSYLFQLLWTHVPIWSTLRVWSRMNILLLPIIGWLLAAAYQNFEGMLLGNEGDETRTNAARRRAVRVLTGVFLAGLAFQLFEMLQKRYDDYWTRHFIGKISTFLKDHAAAQGWALALTPDRLSALFGGLFVLFGVAAFVLLLVLLRKAPSERFQSPKARRILLAGFVAFSAVDLGLVGPWVWVGSILTRQPRTPLNVAALDRESFQVPRTDASGTISLSSTFSVGIVPNWYYNRYIRFLEMAQSEPEAARQILGVKDGRKIYFSREIGHSTVQAFLEDAARFGDCARVVSYTGDDLELVVGAPEAGYLSFIDNWDRDWTAAVDGAPAEIKLLFGTFKSVAVPAGERRVNFAYRPRL